MKLSMTILAAVLVVAMSGTSRGDNALSYEETVAAITAMLPGISSDLRKERYAYIRFDACNLGYRVAGFYPTGTPYDKTFAGIDFSSLDMEKSKTGADVSDYVVLFFERPFDVTDGAARRTSKAVVVDAATHEQAEALFAAFRHLGELCRKMNGEVQGRLPLPGGDPAAGR